MKLLDWGGKRLAFESTKILGGLMATLPEGATIKVFPDGSALFFASDRTFLSTPAIKNANLQQALDMLRSAMENMAPPDTMAELRAVLKALDAGVETL